MTTKTKEKYMELLVDILRESGAEVVSVLEDSIEFTGTSKQVWRAVYKMVLDRKDPVIDLHCHWRFVDGALKRPHQWVLVVDPTKLVS